MSAVQPTPVPLEDHTAAHRAAREAIEKAHRLWPGAHAYVLSREIQLAHEHLSWLGPTALTWQLIREILSAPEPADGDG